jgi:ribonuclease Z
LWDLQITDTIRVPEVAFTGDTTPDFILDKANKDVLEAKLLIMEVSFPIPMLQWLLKHRVSKRTVQ